MMACHMWHCVAQLGRCRRLAKDKFFSPGDEICRMGERKAVFDIDEEELLHQSISAFGCHFPGCTCTFTCILDYELHYSALHRHVCGQCHKSLPSAHLLDLHILEAHDAFFSLMAKKEPMYMCLLEGCSTKFTTPTLRRDHCISTHKFPPDFRFDDARKKGSSRIRGKSTVGTVVGPHSSQTQQEHSNESVAMETGDKGACGPDFQEASTWTQEQYVAPRRQFTYHVPKNISFGQGVPRGFPRSGGGRSRGKKHWHQRDRSSETATNIETSDLTDLQVVLMEEAS